MVVNVIVAGVLYSSFCLVVRMVVVLVFVVLCWWCWGWFGIGGDGCIVAEVIVTVAVKVVLVISSN